MQYTEKELSKLINDVEKEFSAHLSLAKSETNPSASLAKSEDDEHKDKEHKEEKPEAEAKPEDHEGSDGEKHEASKEEHAEAAPAHDEGHDYDEEDLEHMHKMYMSMGKGELIAHHDAIKKCLDKSMGVEQQAPQNIKESPESHVDAEAAMGKTEIEDENPVLNSKPKDNAKAMNSDKKNGGIEGQEPHNALGPKSPASKASGVQMGKSEHDRRNGGKIEGQEPAKVPGAKSPASKADGVQMEKSELTPEVELLKSQFEEEKTKTENLQKSLDAVSAFLTKLVEKTAPKGKAITSLDIIAKSEGSKEEVALNKSEINSILAKKAADPSLTKTDREAINAYYLNNAGVNSISHLLK